MGLDRGGNVPQAVPGLDRGIPDLDGLGNPSNEPTLTNPFTIARVRREDNPPRNETIGLMKQKRRSCWEHDKVKVAAAEAVLRETKRLSGDPETFLRALAEGRTVRLPLRSETNAVAGLLATLDRGDAEPFPLPPDADALRALAAFCRSETDLLTHQDAPRFARSLLALSAHRADWIRPLAAWRARSHNAHRQFRSLLRHLIARFEVPTFLDAAWTEGLTPSGVRHQGWYKLIGRGENLRTAGDLPVPLTRRQAHYFLQSPDDLDIPSAIRRALVLDLGGDDRLARSILTTRIGTTFEDEEFWATVVRYFAVHPELEPARHGPIIDFLHNQKFVPTLPNPLADQPGQPPLVACQPNLKMKGRTPDSLRRAVEGWHRDLAERRSAATAVASWGSAGYTPFAREEWLGDDRRLYEVVELLTAEELFEEGKAMGHCVASYAHACASGRSSIWAIRMRLDSGRLVRLATVEVRIRDATVVQVRRCSNKPPTDRELDLLGQWANAGGPRLAFGLTT